MTLTPLQRLGDNLHVTLFEQGGLEVALKEILPDSTPLQEVADQVRQRYFLCLAEDQQPALLAALRAFREEFIALGLIETNPQERAIQVLLTRTRSLPPHLGGNEEYVQTLDAYLHQGDISIASSQSRQIETLDPLQEAAAAENWCVEHQIGRRITIPSLRRYIQQEHRRDDFILFPFGKGFYPYFAISARNAASDPWSQKEKERIQKVLQFLTSLVIRLSATTSLSGWFDTSNQFNNAIDAYKRRGVRFEGDVYELEPLKLELPEEYRVRLPSQTVIYLDGALILYHQLRSLFRVVGWPHLNPLLPQDRKAFVAFIQSEEMVFSDKVKEWFVDYFSSDSSILPILNEVALPDPESEGVVATLPEVPKNQPSITTESPPLALPEIKEFGSLEDPPLKSFIRSFPELKGNKKEANLSLAEQCERNACIVPGAVQGDIVLTGAGRLNRSDVTRLFLSRPNPEQIVSPGITASQGYFIVRVSSREYRLPWKFHGPGRFVFCLGNREIGESEFQNPRSKNFYYEMERAVLLGLRDLLTREVKEEEPTLTPRKPVGKSESVRSQILTRKIRLRVSRMLRGLAQHEGEARSSSPFMVQRFKDLMNKIQKSKVITMQDLEGLDFYAPEEVEGVGEVYFPVETLDVLPELSSPAVLKNFYLCLRTGILKKSGYNHFVEGATRYCIENTPSPESQRRLAALTSRLKLGELQPELDQTTEVNVTLGPDLEHPAIEWIVLGTPIEVEKYRRGQTHHCLVLSTAQLLNEAPQPPVLTIRRSGANNNLYLRIQAPQKLQFDQGVFINLEEALRRTA